MKACGHCKQKAEWRYKDGWGAFACAEWFTGTCEGPPLDVAPPSVGDLRPKGRGLDEDEKYNHWVKTRLREVWPLEKPMINSKFTLVFGLFSLIMVETPLYAQIIDQSLCVQCVTTAKEELNTCLEAAISQEDKKSCQEKRETRAKTCENQCKIEKAAVNAIKHERQSAIKTPSE